MTESAILPNNFGGLNEALSDFSLSKVLVWPVPYERTVSFGEGTKHGPDAIIRASRNMELFDDELDSEICNIGIHTLPQESIDVEPSLMDKILFERTVQLLGSGKMVCTLGGEHSITPPLVRAHAKTYAGLTVLQIDAHADLRESYDGTRFSHACAMRRVCETCPAVQVGIRSLTLDESRAIPALPTTVFYARDIVGRADWHERAIDCLGHNVYLTFDVDGLDPSIVPTTGTPEPGGLHWYETLEFLRKVASAKKIVGVDFVELSDGHNNNAPAFTVAKLIYKTLGYIFCT